MSLQVYPGDVFGFLGPNGAGKSTTIRMILDLIRPSGGEVRLFDLPVRSHRTEVLKKVGSLVESPDFYNHLSGRRNLQILARMAGNIPQKKIDEVLEIVRLETRADDRVKAYSHGMRQRLGIAQTLLADPELIILDEPTTGLDPQGMKEVRLLIRELAARGITVFLSSHLLNEVEQVCNRMAIINEGKLIVEGEVQELLHKRPTLLLLEVDGSENAASQIKNLPYVKRIIRENGRMKVEISYEDIPRLNQFLVEQGIKVFRMQPQTTLEDYYLSLVGDQ